MLAGCGTVPGVGVPTALISGRLAADRVTGVPAAADAPASPARRARPDGGVMIRAELDAASVRDPLLRAAYERCRQLNARHGRTYYLATQMLPRARRPAVHALYGLARLADDIVDMTPPGTGRRPGRGPPRRGIRHPVGRAARRAQRGPAARGGGGHRGALPDRAGAVRGLLRLDADGPHRARVRGPRGAGRATCTGRPRSSGCRCSRSSARSCRGRRPPRTRRPSARRSS